jgi:hypothetical protein
MKQLLLALLLAAILYSCGSDTVTNNITNPPTPTDTTLLFSKDTLICDFHDSVFAGGEYLFNDHVIIIVPIAVKRVKITCNGFINNSNSLYTLTLGNAHDTNMISQNDTSISYSGSSINGSFNAILENAFTFGSVYYVYLSGNLPNNPMHDSRIVISQIKILKLS